MLVLGCCQAPIYAEFQARQRILIKVKIQGIERVELALNQAGQHRYYVTRASGIQDALTPNEFATALYRDQTTRGWLYRVLNITSPLGVAWVVLGLLGQLVFAGRMVVQWLVSEKKKRSVVPVMFWWLSLIGATMLLSYFVWRKDLVGVLGQSVGWIVYSRNLWLIYGNPRAVTEDV